MAVGSGGGFDDGGKGNGFNCVGGFNGVVLVLVGLWRV